MQINNDSFVTDPINNLPFVYFIEERDARTYIDENYPIRCQQFDNDIKYLITKSDVHDFIILESLSFQAFSIMKDYGYSLEHFQYYMKTKWDGFEDKKNNDANLFY